MNKINKTVLWLFLGLCMLSTQVQVNAKSNENINQENYDKTFNEQLNKELQREKEKTKRIENMKNEIIEVYNDNEYEDLKQELINSDYEDKDDYLEATSMLIEEKKLASKFPLAVLAVVLIFITIGVLLGMQIKAMTSVS